MMKTCQNCHTENPVDAVFCSQCGMSLLARAAAGEQSEVQDTSDPTAKRLRRTARVLALIWAICWTVASAGVLLALAHVCLEEGPQSECWLLVELFQLMVVFIFFVTWVPTLVALRWVTVGGVALIVAGVLLGLVFYYFAWLSFFGLTAEAHVLRILATFLLPGPPLGAGSLLLASSGRRKSS